MESVVPKSRILFWNVKDGWKPICSFLEIEIPSQLFPHNNPTGNIETGNDFFKSYVLDNELVKNGARNIFLKISFFSFILFYSVFLFINQ